MLTTAKAIYPLHHHPQGGQGQRAAGDLDDYDDSDDDVRKSVLFDDEDDTWNKGDSAVAADDFVVGREYVIEKVICGFLGYDGNNGDDLKIITVCGMDGISKTALARKLVCQD